MAECFRMCPHRLAAVAFAGLLCFPVAGRQAEAARPTFVDPTARIDESENVSLGELVYVAPFAQLLAGDDADQSIHIGDESNVQDSVLLNATVREPGSIHLGDQVIVAHNAAVVGPASIGKRGTCPDNAGRCPSFVGFNAVVDGAIIQKDAMVLTLARVAPGVTIPSGLKVLPGKFVRNQAEVATDAVPVTTADRAFMEAVIEVNKEFAEGYSELEAENPTNVCGINFNPQTAFNTRQLPTFQGVPTRDPAFRNRIIGGVRLADRKRAISSKMGQNISLRGDEGEPLSVGIVGSMSHRHTLHALENTTVTLGINGRYGFHSVVHGGGPLGEQSTGTGANFRLGDYAAFFRAVAGDNVTVGQKSLVQGTVLASGTTVPSCTVIVDNVTYRLEWCNVPFPGPQSPHSFACPRDDDDD